MATFRPFNNSVGIPIRTGADPIAPYNEMPLNLNVSVLDFGNNPGTDEEDLFHPNNRTESEPSGEEESLPNLEEQKRRKRRQTRLNPSPNTEVVTEQVLPETEDKREENDHTVSVGL